MLVNLSTKVEGAALGGARAQDLVNVEGYAKKMTLTFYFIGTFNTKNSAFINMCTQRRHFENSKMVNWVNIVQKLTKIQGIM